MYIARAIFLLSLLFSATLGGNPLTNCQAGRAIPISALSGGQCNYPTGTGSADMYASVNDAFFAQGAECGSCFEVTGPTGTTTIMIVDRCQNTTEGCAGDKVQFGITREAYNRMASTDSKDGRVNDLAFRRVSCNTDGNIQMTFGALTDLSNNFFTVQFTNTRFNVISVRLAGKGWNSYQLLPRQNAAGSATFQWNKQSRDLTFPATFYIESVTEQVLTYVASSGSVIKAGATIDFGSQFADVDSNGPAVCPMWESPVSIYDGSSGTVATGWDYQLYSSQTVVNATNMNHPYGDNQYAFASEASPFGTAQFLRYGGFNTTYFSNLIFTATTTDYACELRVYFGNGTSAGQKLQVTTTYQTFNLSMADLGANPIEHVIVFQNNVDNFCHFFFSDIYWQQADVSPLAEVPILPSTDYPDLINKTEATTPVVVVTNGINFNNPPSATSGSTGSGSGDTGNGNGDGENGSNTSTSEASRFIVANFVGAAVIAMAACAVLL